MIPTILVVEDNTLNPELVRDTRTLAARIRALLDPGRRRRSAGAEAS